jgi:Family of unknown function (DUF6069)
MTTARDNRNIIPASNALKAGFASAVISVIIANIYHAIQSNLSNTSYAELNIISITMTSLITSLIGGFVYMGLARLTARATTIFTVLGIGLAVLSSLPQFLQPLHPGFAAASVPLHLIVGVIAVLIIPRLAQPRG